MAKKSKDQQQKQANSYAASSANKEMKNDYKRAFSTCLKAKGYTVN
jgi:predicted phage gp36 major capsid-like protein